MPRSAFLNSKKIMDQILTAKIYNFLQLKEPTEAQIIEGATLLLQCNPNRERGIYNSAMRRPKAMLPWIRTDLKKYYDIRQRGLTTPEVEKFNKESVALVEETLSMVPDGVAQEGEDGAPAVHLIGTRGIRDDHDQLPEEIKAIWERNAERWKKMSRLHFQLAQMIAKPDYAPCDGNELCYQLRQVDTDLRNDYQIYDSYAVEPATPEAGTSNDDSKGDSVDVFTDNVKTIQNARTAISRGLGRKTPHTEDSLKKLQDAVNTLFALKQTIKPETMDKLKAVGISIPQTEANAEG